MRPHDLLADRQPCLMRAIPALDTRLFAHPAHPLIPTRRRIPRPPCFPALKPTRINVLSPTKQRAKERDFLGWW